jgi:hypothetical protein
MHMLPAVNTFLIIPTAGRRGQGALRIPLRFFACPELGCGETLFIKSSQETDRLQAAEEWLPYCRRRITPQHFSSRFH